MKTLKMITTYSLEECTRDEVLENLQQDYLEADKPAKEPDWFGEAWLRGCRADKKFLRATEIKEEFIYE